MTQTGEQWLSFYQQQGTDHKNRALIDIWTMTFDELEHTHDFIQWLFPLPEPSRINPEAPLLTPEVIVNARQSSTIQANLERSFDTLSAFWGFSHNHQNEIVRTGQFETQSQKWCCLSNHNQLRITRMLRCLTLLGQNSLANKACEFLLSEVNKAGLSLTQVPSRPFWMDAIAAEENIELTLEDFEEAG